MGVSTGDLRPCDMCGAQSDRAELVYEYSVNMHNIDMPWEQTAQYCPSCAEIERNRRTWGESDENLLAMLTDGATRLFGDPVSVRWLQGDEHKGLIHIRRI